MPGKPPAWIVTRYVCAPFGEPLALTAPVPAPACVTAGGASRVSGLPVLLLEALLALMGTKPEEAFFVRCDRTTMSQNDLDNFADNTAGHPVFLGELPPEGELARVALRDLWKPVWSSIEEVDRRAE